MRRCEAWARRRRCSPTHPPTPRHRPCSYHKIDVCAAVAAIPAGQSGMLAPLEAIVPPSPWFIDATDAATTKPAADAHPGEQVDESLALRGNPNQKGPEA